jgi:putative ABC transport system substrate-binding protein
MKRIPLLLIVVLVSFFTASQVCASTTDIGVAWVGKSGMAKRVSAGFEKGMQEHAPNMKLEFHKELTSLDELSTVSQKFHQEKAAMVILRSNGAKWLGKNSPGIPTFIGGCNNPQLLGTVQNLESPEGNITGVTYFLPVATQFEIFQAVLPQLKSIMLLLEEGHPSSEIDRSGTKQVCNQLGIDYKESMVKTKEAALTAVADHKDKVSAIIIGNQAGIFDYTEAIVAAAGQTPVLSFSSKPVKDGALGGFVADDEKLGYMLARMLIDVVANGANISDMPVKVDPKPKFYINIKSAQRLGINIPYEILSAATVVE